MRHSKGYILYFIFDLLEKAKLQGNKHINFLPKSGRREMLLKRDKRVLFMVRDMLYILTVVVFIHLCIC